MSDPVRGPDQVVDVPVADGVSLHTRRWHGEGDLAAFVLVHGLASNARLWDGVADALARAGHPVVAVDQRGHGRSSKPDEGYDMETVTDDLAALLDAVAPAGEGPPAVVGQSWGGNVVIELAARFPGRTRAVACIDGGAIELSRRFPSWDDCAAALRPPTLVGTPLDQLEAGLRRMHPDWPESGIQGTLACFQVRDDGTVAPWLDLDRHLRVLRGLWEHHPSARFPEIQEPVLFVNADVPTDAPADQRSWRDEKASGMWRAQTALARVRVEWLVGDHDLHAQHPHRVAELLRSFVLDQEP